MKWKTLLIIIVCLTVFGLVYALAAFRAKQVIQQNENARQEALGLSFLLMDYGASHGKYPASTDELLTQTNSKDQTEAEKLLRGGWLQVSEYEPWTNGFVFKVNSPGTWFQKGHSYVTEYATSKENATLKIDGKICLQNQIAE
jgi:hypothetical protein